jgi:hypothetical protein
MKKIEGNHMENPWKKITSKFDLQVLVCNSLPPPAANEAGKDREAAPELGGWVQNKLYHLHIFFEMENQTSINMWYQHDRCPRKLVETQVHHPAIRMGTDVLVFCTIRRQSIRNFITILWAVLIREV